MSKEKHHLKIELDEEEHEKFNEIKDHYGLKNDTSVMRLALSDSYKIMLSRKTIFLKESPSEK